MNINFINKIFDFCNTNNIEVRNFAIDGDLEYDVMTDDRYDHNLVYEFIKKMYNDHKVLVRFCFPSYVYLQIKFEILHKLNDIDDDIKIDEVDRSTWKVCDNEIASSYIKYSVTNYRDEDMNELMGIFNEYKKQGIILIFE